MQKYKIDLGKANAIFKQITSNNYSEDEKLRSILTVLDMETHNGITKDMILKAFRWLFDYAIEVGPEVRLTEKTETGFWNLKGVSWEQLQEGHVITKDMSQKIYGALAKIERLRRNWAGSGTGGRSGFEAHTAETKESKMGVFFGI